MALSSSKTEYMETSLASFEAIWLLNLLVGLFDQDLKPIVIYYDNQSCLKLMENKIFHDRSKNIQIRYHFIWDYVKRGAINIEYISTDEQVFDILMKPLPRGKHFHFWDKMGVVSNTFLDKRDC